VSAVHAPEELMPAAYDLARRIAAGPPIAIRLAKRALYHSLDVDLRAALEFETFAQNIASENGRRARGHPRIRREAAGGVQGTLTPRRREFSRRGPLPYDRGMAIGAGHALAVGFDGTVIPDDIAALAEQSGLAASSCFARNCPSLEIVLALTTARRAGLGPDVLVMVDHEGGRVHRLPPPFTRFPSAATVGRSGDPRLAARGRECHGARAPRRRFDSGLAPVLDCRSSRRAR